MKKILSLVLAAMMLLSCTAFAENLLEADPEEVMSFNRKAPITDWEGEWVLAAAYIGEDFAEENDITTTGLLAVPEKALTMSLVAVLDGSATGSDAGVIVDLRHPADPNYICHVIITPLFMSGGTCGVPASALSSHRPPL